MRVTIIRRYVGKVGYQAKQTSRRSAPARFSVGVAQWVEPGAGAPVTQLGDPGVVGAGSSQATSSNTLGDLCSMALALIDVAQIECRKSPAVLVVSRAVSRSR